ncbi:hypothetical protein B5F08_11410 [Anaeromassilibacillus sp. An172]|uniref:O-antigen ligase family protein n=1 Tax=Anaeromassilibacillus sp. An172 TaxID=1965570 RepID=UPI000B396790|nr:O-antigen ligase family protein [Anaeromassilibacillus sp. An172]OUP75315.1 hypothetical protein B5F08_11410 [Anaeromassilibacillus sp. An172]
MSMQRGYSLKLRGIDMAMLLYLSTLLLPIVDQTLNTYLIILLTMFLNFMFVGYNIDVLKNKYTYALLLIPLISTFEDLLSGTSIILVIYRLLRKTLLVFGGLYYTMPDNKPYRKIVYNCAKIFLLITVITSINVLQTDPYASRIMATIGDSSDSYAITMNMKNLGGFSIVYLCVALIPFLVFELRNRKGSKLLSLFLLIGIYIYIISSAYTTALIIGTIALIASIIIGKIENRKTMYLVILLMVIVIWFIRFPIADMLYSVGDSFGGIVQNRLTYFADSLIGVENTSDAQLRVDYYTKAWETFLRHPIIGGFIMDDAKISGHSIILDMMARYGLVGIMALIIYFKSIYEKFYKRFKYIKINSYIFITMIVCIVLEIVNPIDTALALIFLVPIGMLSVIEDAKS